MKKLIIGSPIKQKSNILKEFINSLERLELSELDVYYYFIDDNIELESSNILKDFAKKNKNTIIISSKEIIGENKEYICDENSHYWKETLIKRITLFKNMIIDYAKENNFDYLFFIDSDLVLNPLTIKHLIERNVDIVSNVFWTQWIANGKLFPQVWLQDENNYYIKNWDKNYSKEEISQLSSDFINKLRIPGIYEVGGLGACTLLSKKAINSGVNFNVIDNVSFWGEDRHFCIRARVLGLKLYVDTVYPAYHIYRESYLKYVPEFIKNDFKFDFDMFKYDILKVNRFKENKNLLKEIYHYLKKIYNKINKIIFLRKRSVEKNDKIVLSMIVKNEENRYLEKVLDDAKKYVDEVLIIDDASTDNTVEVCEKKLKNIKHKIIKNEKSMFSNEVKLRKKQWKETLKLKPGWILFLDSDEIFEDKMKTQIKHLLNNNEVDVYCFRLYDMWNETEYRDDEFWNAHNRYMPFLLRYHKNYHYKFANKKQHCGRMPKNIMNMNVCNSDIRIKHYGWMREEDRKAKFKRYMELDPKGKNGNIKQYNSILDNNPNLVEFKDEN